MIFLTTICSLLNVLPHSSIFISLPAQTVSNELWTTSEAIGYYIT